MISTKQLTTISKLMSLVLRHSPQTIGLELDEHGWATTTDLIEKMNLHGHNVSPDLLERVVVTNNKQRFAFNADHTKIRANQGHSIPVDVELEAATPPATLYHGTGEQSVASIMQQGLLKRNRLHVHLSSDVDTALLVGSRHGVPAVLVVDAARMAADGFVFYRSANGVWLVEEVPAAYVACNGLQ